MVAIVSEYGVVVDVVGTSDDVVAGMESATIGTPNTEARIALTT